MSKYLRGVLIGFLIALLTTLLSNHSSSIGFMGGQVYIGFPIQQRVGYNLNFSSVILVALLNTIVYAPLVIFIDHLLRKKRKGS